jgi:hypothetical protein
MRSGIKYFGFVVAAIYFFEDRFGMVFLTSVKNIQAFNFGA